MAEQGRRKLLWSSLSRFEQLALVSTIIIWMGVVLAGTGLFFVFQHREADGQAFARATIVVSTPTETATSTPTPMVYPVGWSTATPTVTPTQPTPPAGEPGALVTPVREVKTPVFIGTRQSSEPTPASVPVPSATLYPLYPPDRVVIPAIHLDSAVVPIGWHVVEENGQRYSVWEVVDRVVGWHKTSSYPGQKGNMVLNGHHNIRGEVFRYLVDLEVGDQVAVYAQGRLYTYAVTEKHILKEKGEPPAVRLANAQWIAPTADERLTMVTCWPYSTTHTV